MKRLTPLPAFLLPLGLYLVGVAHWLIFFNFGDIPWMHYDWSQEYVYFSILKEAVSTGTIPYHVAGTIHETSRFMAVPEFVLSPQIVLLRWLPVGAFVVVHALLLYSIGYLGCLALKRSLGLSWIGFLPLYLLFGFTGFIAAHLSVGHSMWMAYFLLPWFFRYLLEWAKVGPSPVLAVQLALVLFAISLQGGFHLCNWCLLFFLLVPPRSLRGVQYTILVVVVWVCLDAVRLIPGLMTYGAAKQAFVGGYPTFRDFLAGLVSLRSHGYPYFDAVSRRMGWWEYDMFVS